MLALIQPMGCVLMVLEVMAGRKTFRTPQNVTFYELPLMYIHVSLEPVDS